MNPAVLLTLMVCCSGAYSTLSAAARGRVPSLHQVQHRDAEIRTLEVGNPIKREADGNIVHLYRVSIDTGNYIRVVVDQQGVDVKVTLFGPDGRKIMQADGPSGATGPEPLSTIVEARGEYRIEVRLPDKKPLAGGYVVTLEALRSPTQADEDRVAAEKLFWEGYELFKQPAIESRRKALEKYQQALPMFRAQNDRSMEYYSSLVVGFIYHSSGESQTALGYYRYALNLCKSLGNKTDEPILLNNIGGVYDTLGEPQKALAYYGEALALWSARNERGPQADTLNNVGLIHFKLGEPQQALDYYNRSLTLKRELGNAVKIANTLNNIAVVYAILGEEGRSLDYLKEALDLQRPAKDISGQAITHYFTAYVHAALGDLTRALEDYNQALSLQRTVGNRRGEGITLDSMGVVFNSLGQRQKALEYHQQALDLQRATKDRRSEAATLEHIGYVHALSGELERAVQDYDKALSLCQAVGDRREEANVLQGMARLERERRDFPAAQKHIQEAIAKIETVRGQTDTQLRASYLGVKHDAYSFYIDLLIQMHRLDPSAGNDATALTISEQAHARSFLEMLSEAQVNIREGVDATLLERERSLSQQVNAKAERLIQALEQNAKARVEVLNKEISELEDQYQQAQAAIRKSSPGYAAITQPQASENSQQKQERIAQTDSQLLAATKELSQMVLGPIASELGAERLVIVADGALQYVPFAALSVAAGQLSVAQRSRTNNGSQTIYKPLMQDHEIVSLPSASALAIQRQGLRNRKPAPNAVAVLADPVFSGDDERLASRAKTATAGQAQADGAANTRIIEHLADNSGLIIRRLKFTRQEADQILSTAPRGRNFKAIDFKASRATATGPELSKYRYVHFATHGYLDSERPDLSAVVLSLVDEQGKPQDGFLRALEIYNLNLPAELVVLSACQTGLGKEI